MTFLHDKSILCYTVNLKSNVKYMAGKKGMSTGKKMALAGAGVATVAAAAAGYYFFGTKKAATHRKKAVKWASDLKKDVLMRAKQVKKLDEKAISMIVSEAARTYSKMKSMDAKDVAKAAAELKKNWQHIKKEIEMTSKGAVTKVKKAAEKVATAPKKTARRKTRA